MSYKELLEYGKEILKRNEIVDAETDAWLLFEFYFKIDKTRYLVDCELRVKSEDEEAYIALIDKRASHIPVQHIMGYGWFYNKKYYVNEDVLVPRQDTELIVEKVVSVINHRFEEYYDDDVSVLDLCTGTGCIGITISNLTDAKVTVVDVSDKALDVVRMNKRYHAADINILRSDMFESVIDSYDIIVSNPPYIKTAEIQNLDKEVKDYDPHLALDGGEDGLKFYRIIAEKAMDYLKSDGYLVLEIGYDQEDDLRKLFEEAGFENVKVTKDLSGLPRMLTARVPY